jgi:inorganic pyrophosphatase
VIDLNRGTALDRLAPFDSETGLLNAIIETPKGTRNKFAYDEEIGLFRLKKVLPAGMVFPFHFGFIPGTRSDDGGPLDILVLLEEPAFPGCLIPTRLLGVIEAKQGKNGKIIRNDRFIGAADKMPSLAHYKDISSFEPLLLEQIEHFFASYNEAEGKMFKVLRRGSAAAAKKLIEKGKRAFRTPA